MSLATPEVWIRLAMRHWARLGIVEWTRFLVAMLISVFVFALTLPERVMLFGFLRRRFGGAAPALAHEPGVLVVLGYYRSGTTHLHYLLSCDGRFVTPRWVQALTPHGFWVSWTVLRWLLTPMLPNQRPQDGVAFGSWWPAEDDFAACNWALASSLPGRLVVPSAFASYQGWQFMETLSERDRTRWRRVMCSFLWKVTRRSGGRMLLLKSPSHTSRVDELRRLFGDRVRFVVISRDQGQVIESHLAMNERLGEFLLEPAPDREVLRRVLADDLARSESAMEAQLAHVPPDRVARMSFEEMTEDPLSTLQRCYEQLGMAWTDESAKRMSRYLAQIGRYTPRQNGRADASSRRTTVKGPRLRSRQRVMGVCVALVIGALLAAGWIWLAEYREARGVILAWPLGFLIGVASVRAAGRGDVWMGLSAATATLAALGAVHYMLPEVTYGWVGIHRWKAIRHTLSGPEAWIWIVFGLLSAYRCASRRHVRAPS